MKTVKRINSLTTRLILFIAIISMSISLGISIIQVQVTQERTHDRYANQAEIAARLATHLVTAEIIDYYLDTMEIDDEYFSVLDSLNLLQTETEMRYIFVSRIVDGGEIFAFTAGSGMDASAALGFFASWEDSGKNHPLQQILYAGEHPAPYIADTIWGVLLTAREPIYRSDGTLAGYVSASFDIDTVLAAQQVLVNIIMILTPAIFLASLVAYYIVIVRTIAVPLNVLRTNIDKLPVGEVLFPVLESRKNEFSLLESTFVDMSKRNAEMIADMNEASIQLEKAIASANNSNRAKTEFLAKMSHEIRTPMNAIIGMTELVLREDMPNTVRKHTTTIKQAGDNLLSIVNDILDFSKIEAGSMEIINDKYMLSSLVHDVISIIRTRMFDSQLRFLIHVDSNLPNMMIGDEVRIRQIMLNILTNAVKFTDSGYISFSISSVEDYNGSFALRIEVEDSGRGIREEDMASLFEKFMQFDTKYNKGAEGTGLGLAISKTLILAMNGEISVKSEYGTGSTFTVLLPQTPCGNDKFAVIETPQEKNVLIYERRSFCVESIEWTMNNLGIRYTIVENDSEFMYNIKSNHFSHAFVAANLFKSVENEYLTQASDTIVALIVDFGETIFDHDLSVLYTPIYSLPIANVLNNVDTGRRENYIKRGGGKFTAPSAKILIVDDINTNLFIAKGLMTPYQMQIDTVLSGKQALEIIRQNRYDLVFMDEKMPVMNGIETTAHIRELGEYDSFYKNLPIVALTANVMLSAEDVYLKNGFNDFLAKPIDTGKLNTILEKWIPKGKKSAVGDEKKATTVKYTIDGLSTENGVANAGGDYELYLEGLAIFYEDGIQKIDEIKSSLDSGNIKDYSIYVHAIKSAAANIGADRISDVARILEEAADQADIDYVKAHTAGFLSELDGLLAAIKEQVL